ncbi:MAG: methyltransferase [Bacteroidota bacterium]|nr:methyltransferase [Bacteroidota bacterium]
MKVCTDSCVFGAWAAEKAASRSPKKILDIGTGTGLLSLMVAQKKSVTIDAIDIDENAAAQANENFEASPWNKKLKAFCENILTWKNDSKYDCIISNPPFFESDLLPEQEGKKNSKHANSLTLYDLVGVVDALLEDDGFLCVLLPYSRTEYFREEARKHSLFVNEKLDIKQSKKHSYFRTALLLTREQNPVRQNELAIKNDMNEYTPGFVTLLKDYYLYL